MKRKLIVGIACLIFLPCMTMLMGQEKNAIYYNKQGWKYLERRETFKAILQFKQSLQRNPRYIDAMLGLADAYIATEAYKSALELYNGILDLDSRHIPAMTGRGFALTGLGEYQRALKQFKSVTTFSQENVEAQYGIAYLYYLMNKLVWAERKIDTILKINPYHVDTLILQSTIKKDLGRIDEAEHFIKKALNARPHDPRGYVAYGSLLLSTYLKKGNHDYLVDSIGEFKRALSLQPTHSKALHYLGMISLHQNDPGAAIAYFTQAVRNQPTNALFTYNLAMAFDRNAEPDKALEQYKKAYSLQPDDAVIEATIEYFLIKNDYKIGHPLRSTLANTHYALAIDLFTKNLVDRGVYHLRKVLFMNPMHKQARERLKDYYHTIGYDRFYIDELKRLQRLYPGKQYRDRLSVAVVKRRNRLYHEAGYSQELPIRDVPRVLVLNLVSSGDLSLHPFAGAVLGKNITFALQQFGRMNVVAKTERETIVRAIETAYSDEQVDRMLVTLSEKIKMGDLAPVDFVVFGAYREHGTAIQTTLNLLNFKTGVVISQLSFDSGGRENVADLSLRAAKYIFDKIPYNGRVLKVMDDAIVVNIGKFDGLKKGDLLFMYHGQELSQAKYRIKKKVVFKVTRLDAMVAAAEPLAAKDMVKVRSGAQIFPFKKKRSKMLE